jgi:flagellar hook-associated protein 3 FlgL
MMRVSNNSIFNAAANNIMRTQKRFLELNEAIASGKRVHKLSVDPPAMEQILRLRTTLASIGQYQQNIERANSWLTFSEISLSHAEEALMRANELALSQASGTANAESRAAAAIEIDALLQQTIAAGNAQLGNQYVFAGRKTASAPFLADGTYQGDGGSIAFEIGEDSFITINIPGDMIFRGAGGGVDVIEVLQTLKDALQTNDQSRVKSLLEPLKESLNQVIKARAEVGARMGRLTTQRDKLMEVNDHLTQTLGETEGTDLAKAITDLTQQQFVYQASLAASAKIIQPTLLDFLR